MKHDLHGIKVAILVADGFEQVELEEPMQALQQAGATVHIISPNDEEVQGWDKEDFGDSFEVDVPLSEADPSDYDALLLPGGVRNPDTLRTISEAVEFAGHFFEEGKPVAAICHAPQLLIEAEVLQGRTLTSFPSLKKDLAHAGANWIDREVVVDNGLVTSRKPADIPSFNRKMIEAFAAHPHTAKRV